MSRLRIPSIAAVAALAMSFGGRQAAAADRSFAAGSLIIPMDLAYQDTGMLQAYGLLFQLLRQGVPVNWVIDDTKTWHAAPCDTGGDECAWDCAIEGSGDKCPYPTASPDFFTATKVVWDDSGAMNLDDPISNHGYRGGPFVIAATHRAAALAVINVWNDENEWAANPWAQRTVFHVVTVHEATAAFTGNVRKDMIAAPTIAVFSDGNEHVATNFIRAAGIPQSNGSEFPAAKCGANDCGPGTANPDMLTVPSIMGDMGTCDAVNYDHKNGSLFTDEGLPAFCQIMSMHWDVKNGREKVECDGGNCPATQAECSGETITYHGHEVVAEVRQFLQYPTHFFAECQAVNAYENTTPNPAWPYLDDDGRDGHFLTTTGMPPACSTNTPCTDGDFECITGGCAGADCCLPKEAKELGAGFLIATSPDPIKVLHPEVPYNQLDGLFDPDNGSEPAYNLSTYLGTEYKNGREVTFITGANGPGDQDVWMTGFVDGQCDIISDDDVHPPGSGECNGGKVSYLGGHDYGANVPVSANLQSQGARLFLNALFEADCVTSVGQPNFSLSITNLVVPAQTVPVEDDLSATFANTGRGIALDVLLTELLPAGVDLVTFEATGTDTGSGVSWAVGSVSGNPPVPGDPPNSGARGSTLRFADYGDYEITLSLSYRVGQTIIDATPWTGTVRVLPDADGDRVPDETDPEPNNPNLCGDSDTDTCDDCTSGTFDPANDGTDSDGDGTCDAGEGVSADGDSSGCGCRSSGSSSAGWLTLVMLVGVCLRRRRRS